MFSSPPAAGFSNGPFHLNGPPVGPQQGLHFAPDPDVQRAFPDDRPFQHGSSIKLLQQAGELPGVAMAQLARRDRLVEQPLRFRPQRPKLRQRDRVKFRIGQIHLQIRQAICNRFGRRRKPGAVGIDLNQRREWRTVFRPGLGELSRHRVRRRAARRQQQPALGLETLDEGRGNDAGFLRNIRQRDLGRSQPLHHSRSGR